LKPPADLEGSRALVTGGSRGLGLELCRALGRAGARVAFTWAHEPSDAKAARASLEAEGIEALDFQGSVSDSGHVREVVAALEAAWGGVDLLVNNAGLTQVLPISLIDEADWDEVMDTNAKGAFLFSRAVLRGMIRRRAGRILNIGNFSSERLVEAPVHYAASKSALRGLTEALAREVGRYGITVNLLAPGLLEEGLGAMLPQHRIDEYLEQCPLRRLGALPELTRIALFLLSADAAFVTGAKIAVDGGV